MYIPEILSSMLPDLRYDGLVTPKLVGSKRAVCPMSLRCRQNKEFFTHRARWRNIQVLTPLNMNGTMYSACLSYRDIDV